MVLTALVMITQCLNSANLKYICLCYGANQTSGGKHLRSWINSSGKFDSFSNEPHLGGKFGILLLLHQLHLCKLEGGGGYYAGGGPVIACWWVWRVLPYLSGILVAMP